MESFLKMYTIELLERIRNSKFITKTNKINSYAKNPEYIKKNNLTEIYQDAKKLVPFASCFSEMYYCLENNIFQNPKCYCGNLLDFEMYSRGYRSYCSIKCRANDKLWQDQVKKTNLEKYGYEFVAQQPHERELRSKFFKNINLGRIRTDEDKRIALENIEKLY